MEFDSKGDEICKYWNLAEKVTGLEFASNFTVIVFTHDVANS